MADISLRRLNPQDSDLGSIADDLNASDSEVSDEGFSAESLANFLREPGTFYFVAQLNSAIAGAAHGYTHLHPTGVKYLYVDEIDTFEQYRRQGVATALMHEVFALAAETGCAEAWLGADADNPAANAFYQKLNPTEVEPGTTYSWNIPYGN